MAPLRPLSWTGGPKDRQAGLGPALRHGMVLSPQLSGPHSPAWSQGPSRVPSGLSRSWLTGDPQRGLGKEKERPALIQHHQTLHRQVFALLGALWLPGNSEIPIPWSLSSHKWTKGEEPQTVQGSFPGADCPPPPPRHPLPSPRHTLEGSAPAQPKGPGWSSGRALAASFVSRWQVTTLLSSPP